MTDDLSKKGFGLRKKRLEKGIPIEKAAKDTRIASKYLSALEEDDKTLLPGDDIAANFEKIYSSYLGIEDEIKIEDVLIENPKILKPSEAIKPVDAPKPVIHRRNRYKNSFNYVGSVILFITALVVFFMLQIFSDQISKNSETPCETKKPAKKMTKQINTKQVGKKITVSKEKASRKTTADIVPVDMQLDVYAQRRTWVMIKTDGRQVFGSVMKPFTRKTWIAKKEIYVKIGNAKGITAKLNGKTVIYPGKKGLVISKTYKK